MVEGLRIWVERPGEEPPAGYLRWEDRGEVNRLRKALDDLLQGVQLGHDVLEEVLHGYRIGEVKRDPHCPPRASQSAPPLGRLVGLRQFLRHHLGLWLGSRSAGHGGAPVSGDGRASQLLLPLSFPTRVTTPPKWKRPVGMTRRTVAPKAERKRGAAESRRNDEPVSLAPLEFEEALKGLRATKPERNGKGEEASNGDRP